MRVDRGRLQWAIVLGLCVLAIVVYWPVLGGAWAPFDDDTELYRNPHILSFSTENVRWMCTDTTLTQRYTPLSWMVWAAVAKAGGMTPFVFHVQGVVVHVINVVLVFFVTLAILRWMKRRGLIATEESPTWLWAAAVGAAVWAAHPLRIEVVGFASQVRYSEACACALGAVLLYLRAARVEGEVLWKRGPFWGALGMFSASVLFYPSAVGLPLLLPVVDWLLLGRGGKLKQWGWLLLEKVPFFAASGFVGVMAIVGRTNFGRMWSSSVTLEEFGPGSRMLQACGVLFFYLRKPLDVGRVTGLYTHFAGRSAVTADAVAGMVALVAVTAVLVALRKRWPMLLLAWAAHVILLLPFGGYFEHPYVVGDRYAYLHDVVIAIAVAYGLVKLHESGAVSAGLKRGAPAAATVMVMALSILSHAQSYVWRDPVSLMKFQLSGVRESDEFMPYLWWELGKAYLLEGDLEQAVTLADRTLAASPDHPQALVIKTQALVEMAQKASPAEVPAIMLRAAQSADALNALRPSARNFAEVADMYERGMRWDLAEARYRSAVELLPGDPGLRVAWAQALFRSNKKEDAQRQLEEAIRLDPGLAARRDQIVRGWELPR